MAESLKKEFEIVGIVTSKVEVVQEVKAAKPDIILMDLYLPFKKEGLPILQAILENPSTAKVIVLSKYERDRSETEMLRAGVRAVIWKNTQLDKLIQTIHSVYQETE